MPAEHELLVARLKAIDAITTLVGIRITPGGRLQGNVLPAITYERVTGTEVNHSAGTTNTARVRFEVTCWADGYVDAYTLAALVRGDGAAGAETGLSGWKDANGNVWHLVLGPVDAPEQTIPGRDEKRAYGVTLDYVVWCSSV